MILNNTKLDFKFLQNDLPFFQVRIIIILQNKTYQAYILILNNPYDVYSR